MLLGIRIFLDPCSLIYVKEEYWTVSLLNFNLDSTPEGLPYPHRTAQHILLILLY